MRTIAGVVTGNPFGRQLIRWTLEPLMHMMFRFEVIHPEYIPATGPVVVIINHIAFFDPVLMCGLFPRLTPLAKRETEEWLLTRPLVQNYGVISVNRDGIDVDAFKQSLRVLQAGGALLIAPEGTRSPTRQLQPAKEGAMLLAIRGGALIVPAGVTGAHLIRQHWPKLQRPLVRVNIGPPFYLRSPSAGNRPQREELTGMTREAMYRLAAQLPPEFRGVYADLEAATTRYLVPAEPVNSNQIPI